MDYLKVYNSIVTKAKSEDREKGKKVYYENHHITPKCLGGTKSEENMVLLTAREHYICHKLLHYYYPKNNKLFFAWNMMTRNNKSNSRKGKRNDFIISSREFERIKSSFGEYISKVNTGSKRSDESREKMSKAQKGLTKPPCTQAYREKQRVSSTGRKHSEETKKKISTANKGKIVSKETRDKLSKVDRSYTKTPEYREMKRLESTGRVYSEESKKLQSKKAKKRWKNTPVLTCPYCGKQSKLSSYMNKKHFDNCKKKSIVNK